VCTHTTALCVVFMGEGRFGFPEGN
jgi:hypothetical protein